MLFYANLTNVAFLLESSVSHTKSKHSMPAFHSIQALIQGTQALSRSTTPSNPVLVCFIYALTNKLGLLCVLFLFFPAKEMNATGEEGKKTQRLSAL